MSDAELARSRERVANIRAEADIERARIAKEPPAFGPGSVGIGGKIAPQPAPQAPVVPVDLRHLAEARERGKELGEPTSYRGGAGAPDPVHIIRRTTSTFGYGPEEYATPLQAQQAHNRAMLHKSLGDIAARSEREKLTRPGLVEAAKDRYGEYRAPGQTLEEIKAAGLAEARRAQGDYYQAQARGLDVAARGAEQQLAKTEGADAPEVTNFLNEILAKHGRKIPKQNAPGYDYEWPTDRGMVDDINRALDVAKKQGAEAGRKAFEENRAIREYEPLFSPELKTKYEKTNPEWWRQYVLKYGPELKKRHQAERKQMREEGFFIQ